jgi:hypothetical protein
MIAFETKAYSLLEASAGDVSATKEEFHPDTFWRDQDHLPTRTPSKSSSCCSSCAQSEADEERVLDISAAEVHSEELGRHLQRRNTAALTQEVPDLLERMNEAATQVNALERQLGAALARYRRRILSYQEVYQGMRAKFGSAFDKYKPVYKDSGSLEALRAEVGVLIVEELVRCAELLERHQNFTAREHWVIDRLTAKVRVAKEAYTTSMSQLEEISIQVHLLRKSRGEKSPL